MLFFTGRVTRVASGPDRLVLHRSGCVTPAILNVSNGNCRGRSGKEARIKVRGREKQLKTFPQRRELCLRSRSGICKIAVKPQHLQRMEKRSGWKGWSCSFSTLPRLSSPPCHEERRVTGWSPGTPVQSGKTSVRRPRLVWSDFWQPRTTCS